MTGPISRPLRQLAIAALVATTAAAGLLSVGAPAAHADTTQDPPDPVFAVGAGANVLPTTRTVAHWHGQFTDPATGTTYGYNMVGGQDLRTPGAGTTTIPTEIIPINLTFDANGGEARNGSDVVPAIVNSPIFQPTDWTSVTNSTGVQFGDAFMRSQFNQVGTSSVHVVLRQPTVLSAETIDVPAQDGVLNTSSLGVRYGLINFHFFFEKIQNLLQSTGIMPESLPIFVTNNVFAFKGIIAFHSACQLPGLGAGCTNGTGDQPVQTYVYTTYVLPNTFKSFRNARFQDIDSLSHEVAEWMDDPFANNTVPSYQFPPPSTYGTCGTLLESGDPVNTVVFHIPGNPYYQTAGADGTWHLQDEVFLPWFARENPNATSEPEASSGAGRYTLMGDQNTNSSFHQPAQPC